MSTLELNHAVDDFFGDNLFSVRHLMAWLDAKGFALPVSHRINSYAFAQVCALLSELQDYAYDNLSNEKSHALARRDLTHPENFYPPASRMKVSFAAANQWRELFIAAVSNGELKLLDYASKLPVLAPAAAPAGRSGQELRQGVNEVGHEWHAKAWALAADIHKDNLARGWGYDKESVAKEIEKLFGPDQLNLKTKTGRPITWHYIVRYALEGWSKHFGPIEKQEKK